MRFTKFLLCLVFLQSGLPASSQIPENLRALLKVSNARDTTRVNLLNSLAEACINYTSLDSAMYWSQQALTLAQTLDFKRGEARALHLQGRVHAFNNVYPFAADAFLRAQTIYRELNDRNGIAECFLQTGVLMFTQKNFNEALKNFREAKTLFTQARNTKRMAVNQYLFGLSLFELGKYSEALPELQAAMQVQEELGNKWKVTECEVAIANLYYKTRRYLEALELYRHSLAYFDSVEGLDGRIICHAGIGKVLTALNDDMEAEKQLLKAFELSKGLKNEWLSTQVIEPIYKLYEKKGDYRQAYEFQKLFLQYRDSIFTEQNMMAMANIRSSYELAKKQSEIDVLNQQEQFDSKIRWSLVLITALLIAVLAGLYRRMLFKKKINTELARKNRELDQTLRFLKTAEQQLIKAEKMAVFGKLSAGIAHEIRNPLNFITNFSDLSLQAAEDFMKSEDANEREDSALHLKKLLDKIGYHGRRADSIVTRMLQHSRSAHTELEMTDISRLTDEFADLAYESMRNLVTNFECRLEKNLDPELPKVMLVPQDMSRIIINLLNNAFYAVHDQKHHHLNGYQPEVKLTTFPKNNHVYLSIADNGGGIPESVREKIFEPFFTTKPMGEGTGLGLSICVELIKAAHGDISVQSSEKGTVFTVAFPIGMHVPVAVN